MIDPELILAQKLALSDEDFKDWLFMMKMNEQMGLSKVQPRTSEEIKLSLYRFFKDKQ